MRPALHPRLFDVRDKARASWRSVKYRLSPSNGSPTSANQWDAQYAAGNWRRLDSISEVAHYMVILGYLEYGESHPRVLDIGCGHGRLLELLARFGFREYLGVDFSGEAIQQAQSLSIPNTRFEIADINNWNTTERFDVVVMNEVLYYADDPRRTFNRAIGWLNDSGVIVVSIYRHTKKEHPIWSQIQASAIEPLASVAVTDHASRNCWDVKLMRPFSR